MSILRYMISTILTAVQLDLSHTFLRHIIDISKAYSGITLDIKMVCGSIPTAGHV